MECPRCDRTLDRYALGGREAVACERCGYIGVPVEHRGERREVESWDDALSRFQEVDAVRPGTVETTDDTTPQWVLADDGDDSRDDSGGEGKPNGADPDRSTTVVRIETTGGDDHSGAVDEPDSLRGTESADGEAEAESAGALACDVCGRRFERRAQLYGHMAVHSVDEE